MKNKQKNTNREKFMVILGDRITFWIENVQLMTQ